jgi:hypothetical protein
MFIDKGKIASVRIKCIGVVDNLLHSFLTSALHGSDTDYYAVTHYFTDFVLKLIYIS